MYRLYEFNNKTMTGRESIDDKIYESIKESISVLNMLSKKFKTSLELVDGYNDLLKTINNRNPKSRELFRKIRNYLTSYKTFIDVWETTLKREFNEDLIDYYKKLLSELYDASFEYRFIYNLRNFTQHVDNPATSISNSIYSGVTLLLSKNYFLENHSGMQKSFRIELENNDMTDIDIKDSIYKVHNELLELQSKVINRILELDKQYLIHSFLITQLYNANCKEEGTLLIVKKDSMIELKESIKSNRNSNLNVTEVPHNIAITVLKSSRILYELKGRCVGKSDGLPRYVNNNGDFLSGNTQGILNGVVYRWIASEIRENQHKYLYMPHGLKMKDYMEASKNFDFD